jgi:hypothetical protein
MKLPHFQQHVDASTLAALLQQVLVAMASVKDKQHSNTALELHVATMELLCNLPAAAQLSADTVGQLLLQAVQQRLPHAVAELASMVVEQQQLSNDQLIAVLESSLSILTDEDSSSLECMDQLRYLAEDMQLSSAALVQLLLKAVELEAGYSGSTHTTLPYVAHLSVLPAAQEMSAAALAGLLQAAVAHGCTWFMVAMNGVPAAEDLTNEQMIVCLKQLLPAAAAAAFAQKRCVVYQQHSISAVQKCCSCLMQLLLATVHSV